VKASAGPSPARAAWLAPAELFPTGTDPLSERAVQRWIWVFLLVGVTARVVRYLLRFPLWEDEAMLSANLDRGFLALLQPLTYRQVAPPLFLWGQLAVVKLLGFNEFTLRLVPFCCGLGSLFLFRHLAGRLLKGTALVLAVGLFAVAYPTVRYTCEAKPYGCDLLLALVFLTLLVEWLRRNDDRWLWAMVALVGPAVGYSYPTLFIGPTVSLLVAWTLWRGRRRDWSAWLAFNLVLVASFLTLMVVNHSAVGDWNENFMERTWSELFPPVTSPLKLPLWLLSVHAGGMLAYPVGGPNWGSAVTLLCCMLGAASLVRTRRTLALAICFVPLGFNLIAAALHRFPYGGHPRFALYAGPAVCILAAAGVAAAIRWHIVRRTVVAANAAACTQANEKDKSSLAWWRSRQPGVRPLVAALAVLLAVAAGSLLRDLTHPYKSGTTLQAREFARWFWFALAHDSELVCLETDLKENLSPGTYQWGWSALYLCNQRIYSPRHARGEKPDLSRVSAQRPLRCALFRSTSEERDAKPLQLWLADMQSRYTLVTHDRYPVPIYDKCEKGLRSVDHIEVFKFVPKDATLAARPRELQ
jgi:4-amino-4-deoxy-L-arabinose transferase-like glycosyltransferase